jgi:hypothetical protein
MKKTGSSRLTDFTAQNSRNTTKKSAPAEDERVDLHEKLIVNHYLRQFNEETIPVGSSNLRRALRCRLQEDERRIQEGLRAIPDHGAPSGICDQRTAEKLAHHCDALGFDAISGGGVLAWLMELLDKNLLTSERTINFVHTFLKRAREIEHDPNPELPHVRNRQG